MKYNVRKYVCSCLRTTTSSLTATLRHLLPSSTRRLIQSSRDSGRTGERRISTRPTRARFTRYAISVLLLTLVCVGSARAQGSPDVVWQGQHTGYLRYTVFSPDGQLLISGGDDRTNKVWQAADGTLLRTIVQCGGPGCAGSTFGFISPDNQTLATSGLRFWHISDGTLERRLSIGGNLTISPDWQYVASSFSSSSYPTTVESRTIILSRVSDGSQVWTKTDGGGGQVAFSPDGQTVAAVGFQGIDMWRVSDGAFIRNITGPRTLYSFSPDGQFVVTAGGGGGAFRYDDTIKLYRVSDGALVHTLSGTGVITSAAFTPDGQTLITSSWDTNPDPANGYTSSTGSLRFWRVSDGALLKTYDQMTGQFANGLSVSPDGHFFSYTADSTVFVARVPSLGCAFQLSATRADIPASGGSGSVSVIAPDGCSWKAVSRVNWINITSGSIGTGNGTVTYQTTKSGNDLTGLLIIAEQTFPVHLGTPACSYTVSSNSSTFASDGGTGTVGVSSPTGCGWDAASNADWLTIIRFGRTGHNFTYTVAPNNGPPRSGTFTVAGQTVTITQQGTSTCEVSVTPTEITFGGDGGQQSITVTSTQSTCQWSVTSSRDWISVTTGQSMTGNGTVQFTVEPYTGEATRTGTLTIGPQVVTITQGAATIGGEP
jgi:WD40 repeat protein